MASSRRLIDRNPTLAALILAAALLLRVLVPAGFMPDLSSGRIAISPCTGFGPAATPMMMPMAMPGEGHDRSGTGDHHKSEMPCGFGALSTPGLGASDPLTLARVTIAYAAIAFAAARAFDARRMPRLRPPSRGPPVTL